MYKVLIIEIFGVVINGLHEGLLILLEIKLELLNQSIIVLPLFRFHLIEGDELGLDGILGQELLQFVVDPFAELVELEAVIPRCFFVHSI